MRRTLSVLIWCVAGFAPAADYFVATNGSDSAAGNMAAPFATVQHTVDVMSDGDRCLLRGGVYHESVVFSGRNDLVFDAYPGETVVFDGTRQIAGGWTQYTNGIFRTPLTDDIWQLFADGELAIPARWPNAFLHDDTVWDQSGHWAKIVFSTSLTSMQDSPTAHSALSLLPFSVSDAMAVLNVGSFKTYTRKVLTHSVGSDTFTVDPVGSRKASSHQFYYLEGKLDFLDVEREWFFDPSTKELYYWGDTNAVFRGKVQDYAFTIANSSGIAIRGVDFFATTVHFSGSSGCRVEKGVFEFPSCTKRVLGVHSTTPLTTTFQGGANNVFFDNVMRYAETHAIYMNNGTDNRIENCLFEYIDWSCGDLPTLMGTVYMRGDGSVFRRNTSRRTGASELLDVNRPPIAELNRFSDFALVQNDGAMVQLTIGAQPTSVTAHNWFFDADRYGARFDASTAPGSPTGSNGLMHHNVGFHLKSAIMQKGDYHRCINNTSLDSGINDIIILDDSISSNDFTITRNNAAEKLSSHRSAFQALPGDHSHNWNGYEHGNADLRTLLRDPDNLDFRPRPDGVLVDAGADEGVLTAGFVGSAPDIGAYEHGSPSYWIAGRQGVVASTPVPPNGSTSVQASASLMWLPGLESTASDVYFGSDSNQVATATPVSPEYTGNQVHNIHDPLGLYAGTYFWRIDAITPSGTVTGRVWSFTVPFAVVVPPGIENTPARDITPVSATIGGKITDGGTGSDVWVSWWAVGGATNVVHVGAQAGEFSLSIAALQANTTYSYQCYAENAYGTNWAPTVASFITVPSGPPTLSYSEHVLMPTNDLVAGWGGNGTIWNSVTPSNNDGSGTEKMYGQTFTPTTDSGLSAVWFDATADTKAYGSGQVIQLALIEDTDTNDVPDTLVSEVLSVAFPSIDGSTRWKRLLLSYPLPLKANRVYGFLLTLPGPIASNLRVATDNTGSYPGGKGINADYPAGAFPGSLPPALNANRDIAFAIQGVSLGSLQYAAWAAGYDIAGTNGYLENPDDDALSNLAEYAFGGAPDEPNDPVGIFPAIVPVDDAGSTRMEYVFRRRTDHLARRLGYGVEWTEDLTEGMWSTNDYTETGSGPVEVGFEAVTNRFLHEDVTNWFIRLRISID